MRMRRQGGKQADKYQMSREPSAVRYTFVIGVCLRSPQARKSKHGEQTARRVSRFCSLQDQSHLHSSW